MHVEFYDNFPIYYESVESENTTAEDASSPLIAIKSHLVDMKISGVVNLFTPTKPFVITGMVFYADSIIGKTSGFTVSMGTNHYAYDNVLLSNFSYPTITGNYAPTIFGPSGQSEMPVIQALTPFVMNIIIPENTAKTNFEYIYVIGYYLH